MEEIIPIVLFAYARPDHLKRTLDCLKENQVPLIYAFCDGAKSLKDDERVFKTRELLHQIDWCEIQITERDKNFGLGQSILTGVTEILKSNDKIIVFEDDLICVPGTYQYLCAALNQYQNDPDVMSITGWTHPLVTPDGITDQPYFDGRAECWVWGTWARAWNGMEVSALNLIGQCKANEIDIYNYGADLADMAENELQMNIWAVRFLYLHILKKGLCLRPPWSMVEHIGFDVLATNASDGRKWMNPPLKTCPPLPKQWPESKENPECSKKWVNAMGGRPNLLKMVKTIFHQIKYWLMH